MFDIHVYSGGEKLHTFQAENLRGFRDGSVELEDNVTDWGHYSRHRILHGDLIAFRNGTGNEFNYPNGTLGVGPRRYRVQFLGSREPIEFESDVLIYLTKTLFITRNLQTNQLVYINGPALTEEIPVPNA